LVSFSAYDPWTLPPHNVPATIQQALPAFSRLPAAVLDFPTVLLHNSPYFAFGSNVFAGHFSAGISAKTSWPKQLPLMPSIKL